MSNQLSNLSTFLFENKPVRTIEINNVIWFLANDVCSVLEYKNPRDAIKRHCKTKGVVKRDTLTNGNYQAMTYISEPNLFRLIIKSKQQKAVMFEEWVMDEVLPTIRKTGSYTLTINAEQQQAIKQAVNHRAYATGEKHGAIYAKLYNKFKVPSYKDLPASKYKEAISWIGGEVRDITIDDEKLYALLWLLKVSDHMYFNIKTVEPSLSSLHSKFASTYFSIVHEHDRVIERARKTLNELSAHIDDRGLNNKWNNVLPYVRV